MYLHRPKQVVLALQQLDTRIYLTTLLQTRVARVRLHQITTVSLLRRKTPQPDLFPKTWQSLEVRMPQTATRLTTPLTKSRLSGSYLDKFSEVSPQCLQGATLPCFHSVILIFRVIRLAGLWEMDEGQSEVSL